MTQQYQQLSDDQISLRAYYLWERDGKPHGRDWEYWLRAKEELACEQSRAGNGNKTVTINDPKAAAKKKSPRTPAFA